MPMTLMNCWVRYCLTKVLAIELVPYVLITSVIYVDVIVNTIQVFTGYSLFHPITAHTRIAVHLDCSLSDDSVKFQV